MFDFKRYATRFFQNYFFVLGSFVGNWFVWYECYLLCRPIASPYAYDPNTDIEKRKGANAKNSFYSGHVQIVAVSTFFIAKVHADYHPSSKSNWIYYGVAGVATGTTAYLRLRGGQHFPSDILLGTALGTLSGILVPQFHKVKNPSLSVFPYMEEDKKGLTFIYQFRATQAKESSQYINKVIL